MADKAQVPLDLQWGRLTNGRFMIQVIVAVPDPNSKTNGHKALMPVPIYSFVLTAEEEILLKEKLMGLQIVTKLPDE